MSTDHSQRMTVRIARDAAEEARLDREFWAAMTPQQRIAAVWPLTVEHWTLKGWDIGEPGLPRTVARVVRR